MKCETCREALSARLDGETEPTPPEVADRHVAGCAACRSWLSRAERLHRTMLLRPAPPVPDLTAVILERTPAPPDDGWAARIALAMVAIAQLGLAFAQLLGVDDHGAGHGTESLVGHLSHESSAWNLAVGVGLGWAAVRTKAAAGQLPALTGFVALLLALSAGDLVTGQVTAGRVLTHGLVVAGVLLLYVVNRRHRLRDRPSPATAADTPGSHLAETDHRTGEAPERPRQHRGFRRPASRHVA
ncbi:zf-HC2 domain-containing protein [Amycolatopsis sp. QT-25]|uniref:zf-HC2 domain-containing protein n=1 Tax=Amycolatopsis sp. QT-25 TaxID=3034022 RepID=UPI0023EA8C88|nr:zf-HC2 domain-containing protein [Amycolatopsis sp. QT-25]WET77471.1 zf-HC2 domain-containing protein [Amycolatopsis sp. QT-25]